MSDLGTSLNVGGHAVIGRRDDERRVGVRIRAQRLRERFRRDAVGHPQLRVVLGRQEARHPTAQHQPVDQARVRVALQDHSSSGPGQSEAQGVIALGGAVGEKPRALRAIRFGGEALS